MAHGLRSDKCLILGDETMEEYLELRNGWLEDFEPVSFSDKMLVEEVIGAHWLLKRAQRRLMETEFLIAGEGNVHPVDWTAEEEHKVELMRRYKTAAERSFYRALSVAKSWIMDNLAALVKMPKMRERLAEARRENQELKERERELERELRPQPEATPENVASAAEAGKRGGDLAQTEEWPWPAGMERSDSESETAGTQIPRVGPGRHDPDMDR